MEKIELIMNNQEETSRLGDKIADHLQGEEIIFLQGQLGAGKTFLARALIRALGYEGEVVSPSFILLCEYQARFRILHLDLYRLEEKSEIVELGLEEYQGECLWLIEWADRFPAYLPHPDLIISLYFVGEKERRVVLEGPPWIRRLKNHVPGN